MKKVILITLILEILVISSGFGATLKENTPFCRRESLLSMFSLASEEKNTGLLKELTDSEQCALSGKGMSVLIVEMRNDVAKIKIKSKSCGIGEGEFWTHSKNILDPDKDDGFIDAKIPAKGWLTITKRGWGKGSLFAEFSVTVKNKSIEDIKDPHFKIYYYAESGTMIDKGEETVYTIIPACSSKTVKFEELAHPQTTNAGVEIDDARWIWEKGKTYLDW